jgi:molybdopterin converting factor subunit 1
MRVTVRLFARLRDVTGESTLHRDLPNGATASVLWNSLAAEYTELASYRNAVSTAINEEYAKMNHPLSDGDEVAFLPPVSGG